MEKTEFVKYIIIGILICAIIVLLVLYLGLRQNKKIMQQQSRLASAENEKKQQVLRAVLETEEREKIRISRELHDSVGPTLSMVQHSLSKFTGEESRSMPTREELKVTVQNIDEIIESFRAICYQLYPVALIRYGLIASLNQVLESWRTSAGITVEFISHVQEDDFVNRTELKLSVFRIVQELLNNAIKHARPTALVLEMSRGSEARSLQIRIEHNGAGFTDEMASQKLNSGIGLSSINNRLDLFSGQISYSSSRGKQLTHIQIPLTNG
jgi:signal transduction histidine kinase